MKPSSEGPVVKAEEGTDTKEKGDAVTMPVPPTTPSSTISSSSKPKEPAGVKVDAVKEEQRDDTATSSNNDEAAAAVPTVVAAAAEQDLILVDAGASKINVIKLVREVLGLGLMEAKAFVDTPGGTIKAGASADEIADLTAKFAEAGAKVDTK